MSLKVSVLGPHSRGYPSTLRVRAGGLKSVPVEWMVVAAYATDDGIVTLRKIEWQNSVAVIGSRKAPESACSVAEAVGYRVVMSGKTLVTGGSPGISMAARRGGIRAMQAGGVGAVVTVLPAPPHHIPSLYRRFGWSFYPKDAGLMDIVLVPGSLVVYIDGGVKDVRFFPKARSKLLMGLVESVVNVYQSSDSVGTKEELDLAMKYGVNVIGVEDILR